MLNNSQVIGLRIARQHLIHKATESEYKKLYQDLSPGYNVYWSGFGDPPTLTYRADFNDMEFNRKQQAERALVKARLMGGNIGWLMEEDMELFACAYRKSLDNPSERQAILLELIQREGPMTIQQMKECTTMLVKEITPALHRLQEAFLIYEDQNEGQDDRGWYTFNEMFPEVNLMRYSRKDALKTLLLRFSYRIVWFDLGMAKSYFKLPVKEIRAAIDELIQERLLWETDGGYLLQGDVEVIEQYVVNPHRFVYAMHRNDFLVKAQEHVLKEKYPHAYPDTLYYLLIDGEWRGAVAGKFRYTPEFEDVLLDLSKEEAVLRKEEILAAIHKICSWAQPPKRYQGNEIT